MAAATTSKAPAPVVWWIVFCALCQCAGWLLSAAGHLSVPGYSVFFLLGAGIWIALRKRIGPQNFRTFRAAKLKCRFRRAFPLGFLALSGLALFGGLLHGPNNYDALAYRVPRVLHWLAEQRWHWIHTDFPRLNPRACGIEWVSAPLIAFTKTDRWLFLINIASLLLLPGLVFGLCTRLGVRRRVAWHWMWLFPTGYCFLLQAGGIGNDLFGAVFPLAAVYFALRARTTQNPRDLWLAILSAGLITASKSSNLPMLLPCLIAMAPAWRLALRHPVATTAIGAVAALASLMPTALLNIRYCGDWTGLAAEHANIGLGPIWLHLVVNSVLLMIQNFAPPIFPFSTAWNQAVRSVVPPGLQSRLDHVFEPGAAHFLLGEMEMEERAGLGFGVSVLLLVSVLAAWRIYRIQPPPSGGKVQRNLTWAILLGFAVALLVLMSRSGLTTIGRMITPYYGPLLPAVLLGAGHALLIKRQWWRRTALAMFGLAGLLLVISPSRPLFPVNFLLNVLDRQQSTHPLLVRAKKVYSVYSERTDGFAPARRSLPPDVKVVGFISYDDPEASLWRPFGSRRVEHIKTTDGPEDLRRRGIQYVLVNSPTFSRLYGQPLDEWLARQNAELLRTFALNLRATQGPVNWHLVKLR